MNHLLSSRETLARSAVENPVFVVGTMRSGTGFMGLYLNQIKHYIGCPFELRRIWNNIGGVPIGSDVCGSICPGLDANSVIKLNESGLKSAFVGEVLKHMKEDPGRPPRFLSKNPHLCNKILLVDKLFPKAQFIWTIRNMEDVVCSLINLFERDHMKERNIRHIWPEREDERLSRCFAVEKNPATRFNDASRVFPGGDIMCLGQYWLESNRALQEYENKMGSRKICQIKQEDILNKPERVKKRIASFLQIEPAEMVDLESRIDRLQMKNWARSLTGSEMLKLEAFRSKNKDEIERIYQK